MDLISIYLKAQKSLSFSLRERILGAMTEEILEGRKVRTTKLRGRDSYVKVHALLLFKLAINFREWGSLGQIQCVCAVIGGESENHSRPCYTHLLSS